MGSAKKMLKKTAGLIGVKSKSGGTSYMSAEQAVNAGYGRMVDGSYQAYSDADRDHVQSANANRNAEYQDISEGSALGHYFGNNSLLENIRKKKNNVVSTLLGGSGKTNLGG